jgi:hypothetical protein
VWVSASPPTWVLELDLQWAMQLAQLEPHGPLPPLLLAWASLKDSPPELAPGLAPGLAPESASELAPELESEHLHLHSY